MNYYITLTGKILNGDLLEIPMEESSQLYQDYITWLASGGTVNATPELCESDIQEYNDRLKEEFSLKISRIKGLREALERFAIDGEVIPQTIIDEREALKSEYHAKILS